MADKEKRMYETSQEHADDMSYENESSTVTLSLREYDKLKDQSKYITDKTLIEYIDKIEFFVKELRKHILRSEL
tara:strand:- start:3380 stop:3601 length:222 start_codon:yes stop_codon:yes gene_type:complete